MSQDRPQPDAAGRPGDDTTQLVRRARSGDDAGLEALVERFRPLLLSQARFRLGRRAPSIEPEEVVQEVWLRALPALPDLDPRDGRHTPVLLRYLATTLLNLVNEWTRREIRARRLGVPSSGLERVTPDSIPDATRSIVSRVVHAERTTALDALLASLDPPERELLVLRGIEQHDNKDVAALLGETANAVSLRYNRLLVRLRKQLKGSVLDEFEGEA